MCVNEVHRHCRHENITSLGPAKYCDLRIKEAQAFLRHPDSKLTPPRLNRCPPQDCHWQLAPEGYYITPIPPLCVPCTEAFESLKRVLLLHQGPGSISPLGSGSNIKAWFDEIYSHYNPSPPSLDVRTTLTGTGQEIVQRLVDTCYQGLYAPQSLPEPNSHRRDQLLAKIRQFQDMNAILGADSRLRRINNNEQQDAIGPGEPEEQQQQQQQQPASSSSSSSFPFQTKQNRVKMYGIHALLRFIALGKSTNGDNRATTDQRDFIGFYQAFKRAVAWDRDHDGGGGGGGGGLRGYRDCEDTVLVDILRRILDGEEEAYYGSIS